MKAMYSVLIMIATDLPSANARTTRVIPQWFDVAVE